MKTIIKRFTSDESGATAIEYGLIAALIAVAVITIFTTLKNDMITAFGDIGSALKTKATAAKTP